MSYESAITKSNMTGFASITKMDYDDPATEN